MKIDDVLANADSPDQPQPEHVTKRPRLTTENTADRQEDAEHTSALQVSSAAQREPAVVQERDVLHADAEDDSSSKFAPLWERSTCGLRFALGWRALPATSLKLELELCVRRVAGHTRAARNSGEPPVLLRRVLTWHELQRSRVRDVWQNEYATNNTGRFLASLRCASVHIEVRDDRYLLVVTHDGASDTACAARSVFMVRKCELEQQRAALSNNLLASRRFLRIVAIAQRSVATHRLGLPPLAVRVVPRALLENKSHTESK